MNLPYTFQQNSQVWTHSKSFLTPLWHLTSWSTSTFDSNGSFDGAIHPYVGSVPEPSTWAMLLLGFAGLGIVGYRVSWRASDRPRSAFG